MTQNRSFSLLKDCTDVRLLRSHTRKVLSSPTERIKSWLGWNRQPQAFWKCPRHVSTSQALVSIYWLVVYQNSNLDHHTTHSPELHQSIITS